MRSPSTRTSERRAEHSLVGLLLLLLAGTVGCPRPAGPAFVALAPPRAHESLLYIYRVDSLRGASPIEIHLDGERIETLHDREFIALSLEPGEHSVRLRLRLFGWIPRAWNRIGFQTEPGGTRYLRIWAGYEENRSDPDRPRETEVPGRNGLHVSVSVFASLRPETEALAELANCTRLSATSGH